MDIAGMMNDAIVMTFTVWLEEFLPAISELITNIYGMSLKVLDLGFVSQAINYVQGLTVTLLVIKVIKEGFNTYILYQGGDPEADPTGLLVRTTQSLAIILCLPWITKEVFKFGMKVTEDVSGLINANGLGGLENDLVAFFAAGGITFAIIISLLILIIAICIIYIQSSIRSAEIALMAVIAPIMALSLTQSNSASWQQWFKQFIITCVSQALQLFMLQGAVYMIAYTGTTNLGSILSTVGWLIMTISAPKFLKQFAYNSGLGGAVGGGAKQALSAYTMRKVMSK